MDWSDEGIVVAVRKHGETGVVATLLTRGHGCHAGMVRGGTSKRLRGVLQPGNRLTVDWRARLEEHLGSYTVELGQSAAARYFDRPGRLAALASACALVAVAVPEREPFPALYEGTGALIEALDESDWAVSYVHWELGLLAELGFGLDLSRCAATGRNDQLAYVSPKSGRAVSLSAGEPYRHKLLPLPGFLLSGASDVPSPEQLVLGLQLTGHFLGQHVLWPARAQLPDARSRLTERLRRGLD